MNKHQLQLLLAGLITALTLLLTGCGAGPDGHREDPGTVVDR